MVEQVEAVVGRYPLAAPVDHRAQRLEERVARPGPAERVHGARDRAQLAAGGSQRGNDPSMRDHRQKSRRAGERSAT